MHREVRLGDCLVGLKELPDASVDSVVTDPPYDLTGNGKGGFMGKAWDGTGIAFRPDVWLECLRVLKPGGHLLAFGGTRTYHRMACAIEDAGFEIRDSIHWMYGSGFPKSLDVSKAIDKAAGVEREVVGPYRTPEGGQTLSTYNNWQSTSLENGSQERRIPMITAPATDAARQWEGWGTALKPSHEPIVVARKPLAGTVVQTVLEFGTGGINIDGCRIETDDSLTAGGSMVPHVADERTGKALGMFQEDTPNTFEQHPGGRWPPNVVFSHTLACTDTACHPSCVVLALEVQSGASRFFPAFRYQAKASRQERNGSDDLLNIHPTVKPIELMRWLVRLVTPVDGTVLDPFTGSGTTGVACVAEHMNFIGFEQSPEYHALAERRIKDAHTNQQGTLDLLEGLEQE